MDHLSTSQLVVLTALFTVTSGTTSYPPTIHFSSSYIQFPENATNGTLLLTLSAVSRNNKNLEIEIGDDGTKELVWITQTPIGTTRNASVFLLGELDADRGLTEHKLYFRAFEDSNTETIRYISLFVLDVNDEYPEFKNEPYQQYIDENQALNTVLNFKILATDRDRGKGGQIYYSMQASGQAAETYEGVFGIDRINASLTLKRELDYETTNFYQYNVTATDGYGLNTSTNLLIRVRDVQDTPPFFQGLPYLPVITENITLNTVFTHIVAIDGDRGIPNDVEYGIVDETGECSSLFGINTTTGGVYPKAKIDVDDGILREKGGFCTVTVQAKEIPSSNTQHGNDNSNTTMTITVLDINDNGPEFYKPSYNATVQENITGIPLTIVGHTGIDIMDIDYTSENNTFDVKVFHNGTVYYDLVPTPRVIFSSGNVQLRLNQSFTEGYDFETKREYVFQIVATETKTKQSRSSTCTVYLTIEDVNDNDPVFNQSEFHIFVKENRDNNFTITSITASDLDTGEYGEITYSLKGAEGKFDINPKTGTIYSVYNRRVHTDGYPLDREKKDVYYLTLQAEDGGRRRTAVSVVITLTDENDNPPHFLQSRYVVSLQEESDMFSTSPFYVNASDNDDALTNNSKVRFLLSNESDMPTSFVIGEETGIITVNKFVDYEAIQTQNKTELSLIVIAYDLGSPQLSSSVTVSVLVTDINDNAPNFRNDSYLATIPEDTTSGFPVTFVSAYDEDGMPPNNEFAFFIETGGSDRFRVNGTSGLIFVEVGAKFDRETQSEYNLTVIAIDKGVPQKTGTTSVFVTISDVNDAVPSFLASPYTATVWENTSVLTNIANCTAVDEDLNPNLKYSIKEIRAYDIDRTLVEDYFGIDEISGEVFIKSKLDAEIAVEVNLILEVEDTNGVINTPQNASGMLTINIDDVNDEPPVFDEQLYRGNLHENAVIGTIIVTVSATDRDIRSEHKQIRYKIGQDPYDAFDVDTEKGTVQLSKSGAIDRKSTQRVTITVLASDGVHTNTASVLVTLIDQTQLGEMIIDEHIDEVNNVKDQLFKEMDALTGKTFHYITVEADSSNIQRSRILFYITDPARNNSILEGNEIDRLVDIYGNRILSINDRIIQIQAYKREEEEAGFQLKSTYVMAAVIVLLVLVLSIIIYFYINTSSKYKRRLKAATVSTSAEKDATAVNLPGSNVYSATANPLLDKEDEVQRTIDTNSYTGSDDDLDENDVGDDKPPQYEEFEEKEVHMDIYEETKETVDPLSLALQGFERARNDKNKLLMNGNSISNGFVNPSYTKDDNYESTDI